MDINIYNAIYLSFFTVAFAILLLLAWKQNVQKKEKAYNLVTNGFDYIFNGVESNYIAFNLHKGLFRMGSLLRENFFEAPISDIHDYYWKWKERDAKKYDNTYFIYIKNMRHPSRS